MQERTRTPRENSSGGGLPSIFGADTGTGLATVASGPYFEQLPVANLRVGDIRTRFRDRFDIDPRSQAVLDGRDVDDNTLVRAGQVLMFTHRAGEKGSGGEGMAHSLPTVNLTAAVGPGGGMPLSAPTGFPPAQRKRL